MTERCVGSGRSWLFLPEPVSSPTPGFTEVKGLRDGLTLVLLDGKQRPGGGCQWKITDCQSHFTPSAAKEDLADKGEVHTEGNFPFSPQLPLFPYHPALREQLSFPRVYRPFHIHTVKTHTHTQSPVLENLPIVAEGTHMPHVESHLTAARLLQMSSVMPRIRVPGPQDPHQRLYSKY